MENLNGLTRSPIPTGVYEHPRPGDRVLLEFVSYEGDTDTLVAERMWAQVTRADRGEFEAELESDLEIVPARRGESVRFLPQHIHGITRARRPKPETPAA